MSSIIIASIPVHGHVTPLLTIAANFVKRGDDVRFVTGSRFADSIAATGASHVPLPPEADFDDRNLFEAFPERARLKGIKAVGFDIENFFARPAKAQYDAIIATIAAQPADVVLAEPGFLGAKFLLTHQRAARPAVVICGIIPLCIESRDTAPFGLGLLPARFLNRQRNFALGFLQRRILRQGNRIINELHRQVHGKDMPCTFVNWHSPRRRIRAVHRALVRIPSVRCTREPSLRRAAVRHRLAGSATGVVGRSGRNPARHPRHPGHASPTPTTSKPSRRRCARLPHDDVLVVVSTGGRPLDTLPPLPANARAATFLPYDELLPRTAVYVTNGGYGGVQYALRYGVPIVATGGKEDKPEVGARVAWSGVGRRIRSERPTPRALRRDILAVLNQPRYRQSSRLIAADLAAAPGFSCLAGVVDRLVDDPARTSN